MVATETVTFSDGSVVKNPPAKAGGTGSIPGFGRSSRVGSSSPVWYSCLENPMDRGAWQAIICGVTKSWTRLSTHAGTHARDDSPHSLRYLLSGPLQKKFHLLVQGLTDSCYETPAPPSFGSS